MHLLEEITVIATVSVLVTLILGRLKLPVVAGLVLSGALVGPKALSLAHDPHAIEVIAEVGVIFLLFTIGLEFSLARLKKYLPAGCSGRTSASQCHCSSDFSGMP